MQQPLGDYYGSSALCSRPNSFSQGRVSTIGFSFKSLARKTKSKAEANIANALKHKIAERRRRRRISQQYDMLRTNVPNLFKVSDR